MLREHEGNYLFWPCSWLCMQKLLAFLNQWETEQQAMQSLHLSHSYVHFHSISTKVCKKKVRSQCLQENFKITSTVMSNGLHPLSSLWNIMSTCLWLSQNSHGNILSSTVSCSAAMNHCSFWKLRHWEYLEVTDWTLSMLALAHICLLGCFICCNFQSAHTSA